MTARKSKTTTVTAGRIELVDPKTLTIAANVRTDLKIDDDFVASIKEHGILQPPMVTATEDGGYEVVLGQRRTLAAAQLELAQIPVYVVDKSEAAAARIAEQLTENDQRQQLSEAERVGGYKQMALYGLKPADIAKRAGRSKAVIDQAIRVSESEPAMQALKAAPITLDDAFVFAEFDGDEAAQSALLSDLMRGGNQFKYTVSRLRQDREREKLLADRRAELDAAGVTFLDVDPNYNTSETTARAISSFADPATPNTPLTEETHGSCPGHVAYVSQWNPSIGFACTDWEGNGHVRRSYDGRTPEQVDADNERHRVIQELRDNLLVAGKVRRAFIADLLLKKTLPTGHAEFTARVFVETVALDDWIKVRPDFVLEFLSIEPTADENLELGALLTREVLLTPRRHPQVPLALALALREAAIDGVADLYDADERADANSYIDQLTAWGYTPSEAETNLLAGPPAEDDPADEEADADEDTPALADDAETVEAAS